MEVFTFEKNRLLEDFVYVRTLCGVQPSSPLVCAPNRVFECGPLQGQALGETLWF